MKQTPLFRSIVFVSYMAGTLLLASCNKEAISNPQPVPDNAATAAAITSSDINDVKLPDGVLGKYYDRGSRTLYRGKAGTDNAILSLDYFNEKKMVASPGNKALVCGYGETNFVKQGWQYLIRYDAKKGIITLAPNDVMAAAIKPNSFKTLAAIYDATTKTFNFLTRFTDMNGNENEVFDILTKE